MIVTVALMTSLSCYAGPETTPSPAAERCTADEVLREIANVLQSGDAARLSAISLRLQDLPSAIDHNDGSASAAGATFDTAVLKQNTMEIAAAADRYRGLKVRTVNPGKMEERVHVEGTEIFVDRMRDSEIVFDEAGEAITVRVATLAKGGRCWKLEHFGAGTAGMTVNQRNQQRQKMREPEGSGFRPFSNDDLCTGLAVYRSASEGDKIGTLVEGYRRYRDPGSGRVLEAVLVQSLASGHVKGIWMSHRQLSGTYINRSDIALQDCSWSVTEDEVSPLPDETPAQLERARSR